MVFVGAHCIGSFGDRYSLKNRVRLDFLDEASYSTCLFAVPAVGHSNRTGRFAAVVTETHGGIDWIAVEFILNIAAQAGSGDHGEYVATIKN